MRFEVRGARLRGRATASWAVRRVVLAATLAALAAFVDGCAAARSEEAPVQPVAARPTAPPRSVAVTPTPRAQPRRATPKPPPAPNPEDVARARQLMAKGQAAYRKGDYDDAERALKQAMTLYPFLADANVTLGKIFLIRGAASRDPALIESARLMFEMARAQNGDGSREAEVLLELFKSVPE